MLLIPIAVISLIVAVVGQAPATIPIAILSGLGAAGLTLVGQLVLRKQTKDKLIAEASDELIGGAKNLLADYRLELAAAKAELVELRDRVARLERQLEDAEHQLKDAKEEREVLERQRQLALDELARVQQRVDELETKLRLLEEPGPG